MVHFRPAAPADLHDLTELCLRSKASWGYDAEFMASCRDELTVTSVDLDRSAITVAEDDGHIVGMAQLECNGDWAELGKLFVDPAAQGEGIGRALLEWAMAEAAYHGAGELCVTSDPQAAPFYLALGAVEAGVAPSESVPGRILPRLCFRLTSL
jgi:GNAT superfamily N-acetyltransferase